MADIQARLARLFAERLHIEVPSPETDLLETAVIDSLQFVELLAALEEEFGVRVPLEELELDNFRTLARIGDFVAGRRDPLTSVG
jgi:acyl carrier protein